MEAHTRAALQSTRDLHLALKSLAKCVGDDGAKLAEITKLKRLAADANRSVQAIRRCTATKKIQTAVELNLLRAAVQGELVDREANSARILDRQRVIFDNLSAKTPSSVAFDRAAIAVQSIESELAKLDAYHLVSPEVSNGDLIKLIEEDRAYLPLHRHVFLSKVVWYRRIF